MDRQSEVDRVDYSKMKREVDRPEEPEDAEMPYDAYRDSTLRRLMPQIEDTLYLGG